MERVGIPVFESRVSPVLDACNHLQVFDIENGRVVQRLEISLEKINLAERIEVLARWGVRKIICAGVSDVMCKYLAARKIELIGGIAGEIEKVLKAYICNRLHHECYHMPGKSFARSATKKAGRE